MTTGAFSQIMLIMRLELGKAFHPRRGWWVYLLALAPVLLYFGNSVYAPRVRARLQRIEAAHPVAPGALRSLRRGDRRKDVIARLGEPYFHRSFRRHFHHRAVMRNFDRYTDGVNDYRLFYFGGVLRHVEHYNPGTLKSDTLIFAAIFRFYFLHLAIFLGCAGVFMNLFRGEMLDRSLHYYLLTPVRREVLVVGKFLAGFLATAVVFAASVALQTVALLWQYRGHGAGAYLASAGWGALGSYLWVTVLACAAYGSLFLAAGLVFRNPIAPPALLLLWESANLFLPPNLQRVSVIYYLQSLSPVAPPANLGIPPMLMALIFPSSPLGHAASIGCLVGVTLVALAVACRWVWRLEINYSPE